MSTRATLCPPPAATTKDRQKPRAKKANLRDAVKGERARPTTDSSPSKQPNKKHLTSGAQAKNNLEQHGNDTSQEMTDQEPQTIIESIPSNLQSPTPTEPADAPMEGEGQEAEGEEIELFK